MATILHSKYFLFIFSGYLIVFFALLFMGMYLLVELRNAEKSKHTSDSNEARPTRITISDA